MKLKPLCEKLSQAGWSPQVSFKDGIEQTITWLKRDPSNQVKMISGDIANFSLPLRP